MAIPTIPCILAPIKLPLKVVVDEQLRNRISIAVGEGKIINQREEYQFNEIDYPGNKLRKIKSTRHTVELSLKPPPPLSTP